MLAAAADDDGCCCCSCCCLLFVLLLAVACCSCCCLLSILRVENKKKYFFDDISEIFTRYIWEQSSVVFLLFLVASVALSRSWLGLGSLWNNLEFEMILKVENKKIFFRWYFRNIYKIFESSRWGCCSSLSSLLCSSWLSHAAALKKKKKKTLFFCQTVGFFMFPSYLGGAGAPWALLVYALLGHTLGPCWPPPPPHIFYRWFCTSPRKSWTCKNFGAGRAATTAASGWLIY